MNETIFIQHKGLKNHEGPPNSFESIIKNYKGKVECDALLLKDGNIAIIHERDFNLSRQEIEELDLPALENLGFSSNDQKATPLLKEFIALSEDAGTSLSLEMRASSKEKSIILAQAIIKQLLELDQSGNRSHDPEYFENKITFESFSVTVLKEIKKLAEAAQRHFKTALYWPSDKEWAEKNQDFDWGEVKKITDWENKDWSILGLEVAANNNINAVEFQPFCINDKLVEQAHKTGLKIGVSLIQNEEEAKKLIDLGVDYILTEK